jgi:sec-independent protein translocase protein TatA
VFGIGPPELIIILILALIVFGPKRLPDIGRTVGKGLREFQKASRDIRGEIEGAFEDEPAGSARRAGRATEPNPPVVPDSDGEQKPGDGRPGSGPAAAEGGLPT